MSNILSGIRRNKLAVAGMALTAGLVLSGAKQASATPSTLGFYPSTDIYGNGTFHYDADSYGHGLLTNGTVSNGMTYGIGNKDGILGRSEVGLDYILNSGNKFKRRLIFNAKTQLFNDDAKGTRVVAGVWGLGDKAVGSPDIVYVTGSKTFSFGRVHVGVAQALAKKATIAAGNDDDRTSLSLGYDKYITPKLQFAADYYTGKNIYSGVQPTLYYYVNDKADFGLGYMRFNSDNIAPNRNQVYVCFDYNFDFAKTATVSNPAPVPETAPAAPATN